MTWRASILLAAVLLGGLTAAPVLLGGLTAPGPPFALILDESESYLFAKNSCEGAKATLAADRDYILQQGCKNVNSCPELTAELDACGGDGGGLAVDDFFSQLLLALAVSGECKDVEVAKQDEALPSSGPAFKLQARDHFTLYVSFVPGHPSQSWSLQHGFHNVVYGEGTPERVAADVCRVLSTRGAKVLE